MDTALNAYKERYGSYPPDGTSSSAIFGGHLGDGLPRYNPTTGNNGLPSGVTLDPSTALMFWLCGPMVTATGFSGFNADPTDPFGQNSQQPTGSLFTPDLSRVAKYRYYPNNGLFSLTTSANAPHLPLFRGLQRHLSGRGQRIRVHVFGPRQ